MFVNLELGEITAVAKWRAYGTFPRSGTASGGAIGTYRKHNKCIQGFSEET